MERDILAEAQRLRAERHPFALATVVAARQPTSGTPGARAIIRADGALEGWIGGQCAQPAVIREGLAALAEGTPRLVVLRPEAGGGQPPAMPGVVEVPMLCASEGELHVFVEPFLPVTELVVIGASPVAQRLAGLARQLDFEVWACDPDADMALFPDAHRLVPDLEALRPQLTPHHLVVIATINAYDEEALRTTLASDVPYVGLIASQRRFAALQAMLHDEGLPQQRLAQLHRPKGLPGTALRPGEIAFSALAELVDVRRRQQAALAETQPASTTPPERAVATDPICGMRVDVATARFTAERDGQTSYFCCPGCRQRFLAG